MRFCLLFIIFSIVASEFVSKVNEEKYSVAQDAKYLIYDVNIGEGFNLRRDVYMRIANVVRLLRESGQNYILVLPPWGRLFHWDRQEIALPWSTFFDIKSLNKFVPVIEFSDYLKETNSKIENIVYLQHYEEGWGNEYVMKYDERKCIRTPSTAQYRRNAKNGDWDGWFFGFDDVHAKHFKCISIQGDSSTLKSMIISNFSESQSILVDRAETILHQHYGDVFYWQARRSMRYSEELRDAADKFRRDMSPDDEYLGVHWRRRDFVAARSKDIPSIDETAKILRKLAEQQKVTKIYLATDASLEEVQQLKQLLGQNLQIFRFLNFDEFNDGQIAIIDQWICAHSKFFIGTYESTFSFRIQEDREILGFPVDTTFNRLCPKHNVECEQPAKWRIVH